LINGSSNLDLYLVKRYKYVFNVDTIGYPFSIKTDLTLGNVDLWTDGVTNNVTDFGTVEFIVPNVIPNKLYYVANNDIDMYGNIYILDSTTSTTTAVPTTSTSTTTAAPGPLDFDISATCQGAGVGTIEMSNFSGGSGYYSVAMKYSTGWYTTQAQAENPDYWFVFNGPVTRNGLSNGTYWMSLRDAANPSVVISKSITVTC
jgi:hypothetical protein